MCAAGIASRVHESHEQSFTHLQIQIDRVPEQQEVEAHPHGSDDVHGLGVVNLVWCAERGCSECIRSGERMTRRRLEAVTDMMNDRCVMQQPSRLFGIARRTVPNQISAMPSRTPTHKA